MPVRRSASPPGRRARGFAVALAFLEAGCGLARAADATGPAPVTRLPAVGRAGLAAPAGLPDGYVATPAGYFHPSCVHRIAAGETLDASRGTIRKSDGSVRTQAPCRHARFTPAGARVGPARTARDGAAAPTPARPGMDLPDDTLFVSEFEAFDGWVESVFLHPPVTGALSFLRANMVVPRAPVHETGSVNYFFPGAQALDQDVDELTIIQPVLEWWGDYSPRGWSISSWNCCVDGNVNNSDPVPVAEGDVIQGLMQGTDCSATSGICARWSIVTKDLTSGESTTLDTESLGQAFNWIFGGVLEVYGLQSCDDLSATGYMTFHDIAMTDVAQQAPAAAWRTGTPQGGVWCGQHAYLDDDGILLVFQPGA